MEGFEGQGGLAPGPQVTSQLMVLELLELLMVLELLDLDLEAGGWSPIFERRGPEALSQPQTHSPCGEPGGAA